MFVHIRYNTVLPDWFRKPKMTLLELLKSSQKTTWFIGKKASDALSELCGKTLWGVQTNRIKYPIGRTIKFASNTLLDQSRTKPRRRNNCCNEEECYEIWLPQLLWAEGVALGSFQTYLLLQWKVAVVWRKTLSALDLEIPVTHPLPPVYMFWCICAQ